MRRRVSAGRVWCASLACDSRAQTGSVRWPYGGSNVTGTSPTMKNISKPALLALRIPLPPLAVQISLVAAVRAKRANIARLAAKAAGIAATARREVEAMILGTRLVPAGASK